MSTLNRRIFIRAFNIPFILSTSGKIVMQIPNMSGKSNKVIKVDLLKKCPLLLMEIGGERYMRNFFDELRTESRISVSKYKIISTDD